MSRHWPACQTHRGGDCSCNRDEPPPPKPGIWIGSVWYGLKAKPSRWDLFWVWFCNGWKYEER